MASEAATVFIGLIGIAIVAVGVMILIQMQTQKTVVEERVGPVARPRDYQWRGHYYSHLPIRPVIYGSVL
jgi:hypothetical protein